MSSASYPILINSASRSGTSLVAELVARWGAWAGDPSLLKPANEGNPRGYWEHRGLDRFLGELERATGTSFWAEDHPALTREKAREPALLEKAERLVAAMREPGEVWFWKSPFLGPSLPFWEELCGGAVYVIPVRDPLAAARSWTRFSLPAEARRELSQDAVNLARWQLMMLYVLKATEPSSRKLFLSYERLVESPLDECRRLSSFLDAQFPDRQDRRDRVELMAEVVDPGLDRTRAAERLEDLPAASQVQRDLYALLLRKIDDPSTPFDPAAFPVQPGYREYVQSMEVCRRYSWQLTPLLRSRSLRAAVAARLWLSRLAQASAARRGRRRSH